MRYPRTRRQTQYVLIHKWLLDAKQQISRLPCTKPEKLGIKEDPNRDTHAGLQEGIIRKIC